MPAGRPSDYDPKYCQLIIEMGKSGCSVAEMASACDVAKQTLLNWTNSHPEFMDAFTRAKSEAQSWWERQGRENLISSPGAVLNASLYGRSMAARFPEDWRESKQVELAGGIEVTTKEQRDAAVAAALNADR